MAKEIPLSRGLVAIVDDEDYEWLSHWKWYASSHSYAVRNRPKPERGTIRMHREIMSAAKHLDVDHINGNTLDNRRGNLRVCSHAENARNVARLRPGKSGKYKGAVWHSKTKRWRARIRFNQKNIHIGLFDTELEAARAYDAKAIELFGEFAHTNEMLGLYEKEPACPVEAATKPDTRA